MNLIYIHEYFVTNEGTSATRSYDVSRYLAQWGHRVTMITGLHEQSGLARLPWWRLFAEHDIDGIRVVTCNSYYSNKLRVHWRMWAWAKFAILATWVCLRTKNADLIFATSTPPTVGIPARIGSAMKGIPYVFEVRDLWPEDLLAAGRMKKGLAYRFWECLETFCYARARKILLVSKGFHDRLLERGFDPSRLKTIVLGADGSLFRDVAPDSTYLRENGLDGKIVAVYTGAHGDANGLDQILDAADRLRDRTDIVLVMIGTGMMRDGLMASAAQRNLTNVRFLPPVPKLRLPAILTGCHIGLMILKQISRPRWVTPNKIFDYMFAGLPTIVNFAGTTAEMVVADGSGVVSTPGSADDLAAKIRYYADHPEVRAAVGRRAREIARQKYDREAIARELADVFEEVTRAARTG
ncbi:MAG TPA: glycosyltransferase family 4 protein [Phycisphaerae bacterium]|nr:glycosyltransferase family 4 protein [Phycisphaerae bacterium]